MNRQSCLTAILLAIATFPVAGTSEAADATRVATIDIPGKPLDNFDIGFVDAQAGRYYFADRANASVDVFDTKKKTFLFHIPGFTGSLKDANGPDGVLVIPELKQLWAGDGDSTVKVFDVSVDPPVMIKTINTGGKKRVDEMAFDPKDKLVVTANDSDKPAFLTFVSTDIDHQILGKLEFPDATDGIEQPLYVAETGMIYQSIPIYKDQNNVGGLAVIDPAKRTLVNMILVDGCQPAGNAHGPGTNVLLGCKAGSAATKMPAQSVIVDVASGKIVQAVSEVGGSDEVWYNPGDKNYYLAARDNPGGPVLGIIDAAKNAWLANIPTAKNSHSVAADSTSNDVFVPMMPNDACKAGCVAVYAAH